MIMIDSASSVLRAEAYTDYLFCRGVRNDKKAGSSWVFN